MSNDQLEPDVLQSVLLGLFPPPIRGAVLDDKTFRDRLGVSVDASIRLDQIGISFRRSALFNAIRCLLDEKQASVVLGDSDDRRWTFAVDDESKRIRITSDGQQYFIPDFTCLSSDRTKRLAWFDHETEKFMVDDESMDRWRTILNARNVEDEEVDSLFSEFRLTPLFVAGEVVNELRKQTITASSLVPSDLRYYDRLVGKIGTGVGLKGFVDSKVTARFNQMLKEEPGQGLKHALLLCSHSWVSQAIKLSDVPRERISELYQWLDTSGDRLSQLGGIECALAHLDAFPEVEASITRMLNCILTDQPDDQDGRLNLLYSLIVLVEGELARTGICRQRPPFWRRLAAIAQAASLERAIVAAGLPQGHFSEWAIRNRGQLFYLQALIDMREEPRWSPDFLSPKQLRAEFVSRIATVARTNDAKIKTPELRRLLYSDSEPSVRSQLLFPFSYLPGPLEGGHEAVNEMPSEVEADLRARLAATQLSANSFASLVNSALIFRIGPLLAQLAADALKRVKYQLRQITSQEDAFSLLIGLATVASVTRSIELAEEVRILMRVVRQKPGISITQGDAIRIALIAAAANVDVRRWCKFVGDCLIEFAFEDMSKNEALVLRHQIHLLRQLEPKLWETTAQADAACAAFIQSSAA